MAREKAGKKYLVFLGFFTSFLDMYLRWLGKNFSSWTEGQQHWFTHSCPRKTYPCTRTNKEEGKVWILSSWLSFSLSLTLHSCLNNCIKKRDSETRVELSTALRLCQYHCKSLYLYLLLYEYNACWENPLNSLVMKVSWDCGFRTHKDAPSYALIWSPLELLEAHCL